MHGSRKTGAGTKVGTKATKPAHKLTPRQSTRKLAIKSKKAPQHSLATTAPLTNIPTTTVKTSLSTPPFSPLTTPSATLTTSQTTPTLASPQHASAQFAITHSILSNQHCLVKKRSIQKNGIDFQPTTTFSKRGITLSFKDLVSSILPETLSTAILNSAYGQTDKIKKKKTTSSGGGGNNDDGDDDDDDDKKKKKKEKKTDAVTGEEEKTTKKTDHEDKEESSESDKKDKKDKKKKSKGSDDEEEESKKDPEESKKDEEESKSKKNEEKDQKNEEKDQKDEEKDKKSVNKFKNPNTLGSIFNLTPDEVDQALKNYKEDSDEKKKDDDKKKKKKKSKDDKKDDPKSKKDKKDDHDDDSEDKDLEKNLKKLKKKGDKDKGDKDEDDDDDDGPELSEKVKTFLKFFRITFHLTLSGLGVAAFIGLWRQLSFLNSASSGSYEKFRQYLGPQLVEKIKIYEDRFIQAKLKTFPEKIPGPDGELIPNPATIPPDLPSEYNFGVLDLGVFSRQLTSDLQMMGVPDINITHSTFFSLPDALMAALYTTIFYALIRKAINPELGWIRDKPMQLFGKDMKGMGRLMERPKVWKTVKDIPTRFPDVAGMDESKAEIVEFVDFLKNPDKYHSVGAKLPKGALLHGPPGTGKTLLAKAVAGEAGVPFITASGSEFVQTYVGMGAKRVRELFAQARKHAPCIIFIDEVDAIARKRDSGGSHDEREATLNQLLVEMDGFHQNEKIIVLAATNRIDMLDKAFVRPGRIDRKILVDLPDLKGRQEVFKVHLKKVVHSFDPDELGAKLAALTPGLSGADISNICNEAAIYAAREAKSTIELVDFEAAIDRVIAGLKKKGLLKDGGEDKKIVAYHESGHAVAGWFLEHADPLLKVTITPRTNGALGFAQYMPKQSGIKQTEELYDRLCVALGGRAAEEIFFQKVSTGASDDLRKVTNLAQSMIVEWGMSPKLPNMVFPESDSYNSVKPMSDRTSEIIDEEVIRIVHDQYSRVKDLLVSKKEQLEVLSETLLKEETINHDTIVRVLGPRPFQNDEYLEFIKQSHKQLTPQEKAIIGVKDDDDKKKDDKDGPHVPPPRGGTPAIGTVVVEEGAPVDTPDSGIPLPERPRDTSTMNESNEVVIPSHESIQEGIQSDHHHHRHHKRD